MHTAWLGRLGYAGTVLQSAAQVNGPSIGTISTLAGFGREKVGRPHIAQWQTKPVYRASAFAAARETFRPVVSGSDHSRSAAAATVRAHNRQVDLVSEHARVPGCSW